MGNTFICLRPLKLLSSTLDTFDIVLDIFPEILPITVYWAGILLKQSLLRLSATLQVHWVSWLLLSCKLRLALQSSKHHCPQGLLSPLCPRLRNIMVYPQGPPRRTRRGCVPLLPRPWTQSLQIQLEQLYYCDFSSFGSLISRGFVIKVCGKFWSAGQSTNG